MAHPRARPSLLVLTLVLACGPDEKDEPEPEVMHCAELPEELGVLRAIIDLDESAITIAIADETNLECSGPSTRWTGRLQLPPDIAPGAYALSESPPSLYVFDYTIPSCMGSQSFGIDRYATGTVTISSVQAGCVAGEIEAVDEADDANTFKGAFAAEPR
ncbi:MAG TPA: hypothetical protein VGB85_05810 [Nannocystis sp.]